MRDTPSDTPTSNTAPPSESAYDYEVFRDELGWGTVEAWSEGRGKWYQSSNEEIGANRKRGLHYGYDDALGRMNWAPIDKDWSPQSDYVPKVDITQKEIDTAVDSIQQRTNHINHRQAQYQEEDVADTDDGITVTSGWFNKMVDEVKLRLSSPALEDLVNLFYTTPGKNGKPEIPATKDPRFLEMLGDGALEANEQALFEKYLKKGTMNSYSNEDGDFVQEIVPHPEIASHVTDNNWLYKRFTEHTNKNTKMKAEIGLITSTIRQEEDSETKDYLMEMLIDEYGWVRKDFTDRGLNLTPYAKGLLSRVEWDDTREDMDPTTLHYPDGSFVPEGHYYDTALDKTVPIETLHARRGLGLTLQLDDVPEAVVDAFMEMSDILQDTFTKDTTALYYPDGTLVAPGYYYDIEKNTTVAIEERIQEIKKEVVLSAEEVQNLQNIYRIAQLEAGRQTRFSGMSDQQLDAYITGMKKQKEAEIKGITIANPKFHTTVEAIAHRFDERFGTNYNTWEDLNQGILAGGLSLMQISWVDEMYRWAMERLPKSSATATDLSKMNEAAQKRTRGQDFQVPWDPRIKLLLGGISTADIDTIINDRGQQYPEIWKEYSRLNKDWNEQRENYKSILLGNEAMKGWDTEMVTPELSRLDQVLGNMFLPFDQMVSMHASGDLNFWEPGFEQWALFAGRMYANEYGSSQSGASDNFNTHLKHALHVIHTMQGEVTPEATSAMLFLFGIKAGSAEADDSVFFTKALQAAGQPVESAAILGVTLEYLLHLSGGDLTSLDPNQMNQAVNTINYQIASAISAASYTATTDRYALEALVGRGNIRDMGIISQNIRVRSTSAAAIEGTFDPEVQLGAEQSYELQNTEYDELLRVTSQLLPSLSEGGEIPDVEAIETLLLEAAMSNPVIDSLLAAPWAADANAREKLLYVFRTMMLTEESALAFKGAMFTALIANKRTPMAGTTERNMMQMSDVFGFWETYLNRQNTMIIPLTYKNGEYYPATTSWTKDFDYSRWARPTEDQPDAGVLNAMIYNDLNQTRDTQAENDAVTRRAMIRNFTGIVTQNGRPTITEEMLMPAINKVLADIAEIDNQGNNPVGLIESQLLLALEIVEGEHKIDPGMVPAKLADLSKFALAHRAGDRLKGLSFGLDLGRSKTTGSIRGIRQAPHIRINAYEMVTTDQPGGFLGLFIETTNEQKITQSISVPWLALHNDDYEGTTLDKEVGLQGSTKDFMIVSKEQWDSIMRGEEQIPGIGGLMEWAGGNQPYQQNLLKDKYNEKYKESHDIRNGRYGIKIEFYGTNGKWTTHATQGYTKVRVRKK